MKMGQLAEMGDKSIPLDIRSFNVVINAYAKSRDHFAAQKAHRLLDQVKKSVYVRPDVVSYTSVIECYSKSSEPNASEMALELLDQLRQEYHETGDRSLMPNLRTFTMVILALARCPKPGNAQRARELLDQLLELHKQTHDPTLKPNEYPYNYVLNCAANTIGTKDEKIAAFKVAAKTYQDLRSSPDGLAPDSFTYAFGSRPATISCHIQLIFMSSALHLHLNNARKMD